ncbi:MAG: type III pantothenate kinase [Gammaproteobacteria bacterium]
MRLLVDVGNTRIKWCLARGRELSDYGAVIHAGKPADEILTTAWRALTMPERVVVANVAGKAMAESLDGYCRGHFKLMPEYVAAVSRACGVSNGYAQPAQLGADRWAAIIGAYHRQKDSVCVASCGTAITVDTVTRTGQHLGGLIAPGIGVMHKALANAAAAIPDERDGTLTLFAQDTRTAVASGILYAAAGFMQRAVTEIRAQQGAEIPVLLTGGDAEILQPLLHGRITLAPHLVLEGLAILAEQRA